MKYKKIINLTIEKDSSFPDRYQIISQVPGYPKWAESIEGDSGGSTFSSKKEALKFIPEIKKEIKLANPDFKVIFKKGK